VLGDDGPDRRDAHHRRIADDGVHLIALQQRHRQNESHPRLGGGRGVALERHRHGVPRDGRDAADPFAAAAVEDTNLSTSLETQDARGVMRLIGRQRHVRRRRIGDRGYEEPRTGHAMPPGCESRTPAARGRAAIRESPAARFARTASAADRPGRSWISTMTQRHRPQRAVRGTGQHVVFRRLDVELADVNGSVRPEQRRVGRIERDPVDRRGGAAWPFGESCRLSPVDPAPSLT
jgi:hypothetical protein